jgi:hypothetical protein
MACDLRFHFLTLPIGFRPFFATRGPNAAPQERWCAGSRSIDEALERTKGSRVPVVEMNGAK